MSYHVVTRWGDSVDRPSEPRMLEVLKELEADDPEHPDCWLTHESGWTLSVGGSGRVIYENLSEESEKAGCAVWRRCRERKCWSCGRRWRGGISLCSKTNRGSAGMLRHGQKRSSGSSRNGLSRTRSRWTGSFTIHSGRNSLARGAVGKGVRKGWCASVRVAGCITLRISRGRCVRLGSEGRRVCAGPRQDRID